VLACDSVVFSAGQATDLTEAFGLELNRFGYPASDSEKLTTSLDGVFAAGDVITGTKFVIDAIAGGRKAAAVIDRYLGGDGRIDEALIPYEAGEAKIGKAEDFAKLPRAEAVIRPVSERRCNLRPVNDGLTPAQASCEAGRCLQCDLRKQLTRVKLWTEYAVKGAQQ
jgi:NADPH-dependent glutamate synthase beta subunit-like oxidoreductase